MGLKTLLVCLNDRDQAETLMKFAVPLARKHNAHLIGLHAVEGVIVYPGIAMHVPEPAFALIREGQTAETKALKAVFDAHTKAEDFPSEWRFVRSETAAAIENIVESARVADAVIMSQPGNDYFQRQILSQVIRDSGRPVFMVPVDYDGPTIGQNIVLGWSNTREAARAGHDLIAVTDPDARVTLLHVNGRSDALRDTETIDLASGLARHGLKSEVVNRTSDGQGVAEILNQVALENGADLIATGAFGHSKAYDFVVGAATYALLDDAKLPVMFSK